MSQNFIFFYGLFMDPDILHKYGCHPSKPQIVKLKNYTLLIGERATLKKDDQDTVWGTIMSLNDIELNELYSAPSVSEYIPIKVICETNEKKQINALTYILPDDYPVQPFQNIEYATQLLSIFRKLSLPLSYQHKIKSYLIK